VSGGVDAHLAASDDLSSVSVSPLNVRFSGREDVTSPEVTSSREVTRRSTAPPQSTFIPAIVDSFCFDSPSYYRRRASNRSAPSMSVAAAALKRTASERLRSRSLLVVCLCVGCPQRQAGQPQRGTPRPVIRHCSSTCSMQLREYGNYATERNAETDI